MIVVIITEIVLFTSLALMIVLIIKDQIQAQKEYKKECEESTHKIYKINDKYGYMNHERITIDNVEATRELPKNNNIYYNAALLSLNDFKYNPNYLFGAIVLQWIKDSRITKGNNNELYLTKPQYFENEFEKRLFGKLQEASKNNVLEANELKNWVKKNYYAFYDLLMLLTNSEIKKLCDTNHIQLVKTTFVMDDQIYYDSVQLLGLKKYLMSFSDIKEKDIEEVHIWEEYLIYASLFGIADKVNESLKEHYPNMSEYTDAEVFFGILGTILIMFLSNND